MMIKTLKTKLIKFALFFYCCFLTNVAISQTTNYYTLCKGDSVLLFRLSTPPDGGGPVGPYPPPGSSTCSYLNTTIEPNDGSVVRDGDRFVVAPDQTTTYIVSSQYIGGTGSGCNPSSIVMDTIIVQVKTCNADIDSFTICKGESVTIPDQDLPIPPPPPQGPPGTSNCLSLYRSIQPNDDSVEKDGNDFILSPTVTTTYTITSSTGPAGPGDTCIPSQELTTIIEVVVEECDSATIFCNEPLSFTGLSDLLGGIEAGLYGKFVLQHYGPTLGYYYEIRNICPYPSLGPGSVPFGSQFYNCEGDYICSLGGLAGCQAPVNEAIQTLTLQKLGCETTGTEHQICTGESVFLEPEGFVQTNPSGAPDNYPQTYNCGTTQLSISPANNVVVSENGFTVNPTVTTTYTITSNGESATCPPQSSVHTVVVEECDSPNEDEIITICKGESTTINLNLDDFDFETGCFTCNAFRFEAINWSENGINISNESSFTISPTQSTIYELDLTVESGCSGSPGNNPYPCGVLPNPYRFYSFTYQVEVIENCDPTERQIFIKYPWLSNVVDINPVACVGTSIIEYDAGSYNFIYIKTADEGVLYFENGAFYCKDQPNYSCVNAYNLTNIVDDSFSCSGSGIPGCTDPDASNYDPSATEDDGMCEYDPVESSIFSDYPWLSTLINTNNCSNESITLYDAGSYYFLEIKRGSNTELYYQNGAYYCSDSPSYSCAGAYGLTNIAATWQCNTEIPGCTDPNALNYNLNATEDDGSCTYDADCNNYQGTFFFEDCGGENYYFIQLADGRIFDPYFADGISFSPFEGQQVILDFVLNTEITTPCSGSEAPITITCIEEVRGYPFEVYPWLSNIVDVNDCAGTVVRIYDAGSYDFISIETTSGTDLYYQNGTYYCSDSPGYSCVQAYNLNDVVDTWSCQIGDIFGCTDPAADNYNPLANINDGSCIYDTTTNFDFIKYPWLNTIVNPINCSQQPRVTEYDFGNYAFIYVKTVNGGSLYLNNGTFYCSDEDGQTCIANYNLTEASLVWTCVNGSFQQYNNVFVICPGEEVTLRPDYVTNFIPCVCPPCAPVGPPGPPRTTWLPPGACSNNYCFPLTVSPLSTTLYTADAEAVTYGYSGCFPPSPPPPAGPNTQTTFLVIVEPCPSAKTGPIAQTQKLAEPTFNIYPNPATDKVFVELPDIAEYEISLMDISGKKIQQKNSKSYDSIVEINVNHLPKGIYLIELKSDVTNFTKKLIVK